jgi:hypothetical protein
MVSKAKTTTRKRTAGSPGTHVPQLKAVTCGEGCTCSSAPKVLLPVAQPIEATRALSPLEELLDRVAAAIDSQENIVSLLRQDLKLVLNERPTLEQAVAGEDDLPNPSPVYSKLLHLLYRLRCNTDAVTTIRNQLDC